jgi:beta-lactamase regulating signal transducer with metallopeptidase domain
MTTLVHWLYPGDGATCLVVNLLVQITVAVVLAALVSGALLRRWPAAQHAVWLACLGFVLVCPLTAFSSARNGMLLVSLTPAPQPAAVNSRPNDRGESLNAGRERGVPPHDPSGETPLLRQRAIGPADAEPGELPDQPRDSAAERSGGPAAAPPVAAAERKLETVPTAVAKAKPLAKPFDFRPLVAAAIGVWAAGVLFLALRLAHGILAVSALRRTSTPLDPSALGDVLADVRRLLGLSVLPPIGNSERIATPVVAGLFRPAVLLPESLAAAIGQGRIRDILLHECAHVARRDPWVVVLQRLVAVAYWPHPLIHFLNRQLAQCREEVCDNWVLRAVPPADYADTLLEVAIHCRDHFGVDMPIGLFDVHGKVEDRVRRLLDRRRDPGVRLPARARWGVLAAAAIFLAVATLFPLVAPARAEKQPAAEMQTSEKQPANQAAAPSPNQSPRGKAETDKDQKYIEGITADSDGKPLAGVEVHNGFGATRKTAVSGSDGRFRLPTENSLFRPSLLAESKDHSLIGFSVYRTQSMPARPQPGNDEPIRIVLKAARAIRVKVATSDGKPVAGVTVQANGRPMLFPESQTDQDGQAVLRLPSDADIQCVVARKDDLGLDYYEDDGGRTYPFPATIELHLHKACRVRVRTIDSAGRPVAGVFVTPGPFRLPGKRSSVQIARFPSVGKTSDANGACEFAWVPADVVQPISFHAGTVPATLNRGTILLGYSYDNEPQWDPAQPQIPVTFHLRKNAAVSGTVRFPDGKPAAGISVTVTWGHTGGRLGGLNTVSTRTSADGHYWLPVQPRQPTIVAVSDRDWATASHTGVRVDDGQTRDHLDFALSHGTRIHGRITLDAGFPHAGRGQVTLIELGDLPEEGAEKSPPDAGYRSLWAPVDGKGNYEFRVGPGSYILRMPGSTAGAGRIKIKVAGQPELVYDDTAAWPDKLRVNGRVVNAADGKPIAGTIVNGMLRGQPGALMGRSGAFPQYIPRDVRLDVQGRFSMTRLPDTEKVGFYARAPEANLAGMATFSSSASEVKIKLRPAATLVGRVYDAQGKPAAGQQVTANLGIRAAGFQSVIAAVDVVTDKSGRYRVPCLAVGSQCFIADPGRGRNSLMDVKLDRAGEISARDLVLPAEGPAPAPAPGQLHAVQPSPPATAPEARRPRAADLGSKTKTLTGIVAVPDGAPLDDILIQYYPSTNSHETRTDKAGRFRVTVPAAGETVLRIFPKQYSPMQMIAEPPQEDLGVMTMKKGIALSGTILDSDGKPVSGQWVCVYTVPDLARRSGPRLADMGTKFDRYARSDAAGNVTFDPLPPGDYLVQPSDGDRRRPGRKNSTEPIKGIYYTLKVKIDADGARPFELKAVHTVKIVAQLYGSNGKKIVGGNGNRAGDPDITCVGMNTAGVMLGWQTTAVRRDDCYEMLAPRGMTNADLRIFPRDDSPYSYRFLKSADTPLQSGRLDLGTLTGALTDIRVIRYVAPVLLVKASDRAGKLVGSAEVSARYDDASLDRNLDLYFEKQKGGRFRSENILPEEKFTVTVTADGYRPQSRRLSLAEGTTSQLDLLIWRSRPR